jgi:hypothetical protein
MGVNAVVQKDIHSTFLKWLSNNTRYISCESLIFPLSIDIATLDTMY